MENAKEQVAEEGIDIKGIIYKFLGRWYLFVLCLLLALGCAYYIAKSTQSIYQVSTSILLKGTQSMLDQQFSSDLLNYSSRVSIPTEIGIIKSYDVAERTLEKLNFSVGYYEKTRFNEIELYNASPFTVVQDTATSQPVYLPFHLRILSPTEFEIKAKGEELYTYNFQTDKFTGYIPTLDIAQKGKFYNKITIKDFSFYVIPKKGVNIESYKNQDFIFRFFDKEYLINTFRQISVSSDKTSYIVTISIEGTNVQKLADYLNPLTKVYLERGLERKNQIAVNTIKFIDSQLTDVSDSLNYSETKLQNYRAVNNVMNMDFQAQQVITSLENLKNRRAEIVVKSKYYDYLKKYLNENNDGSALVAPSALGIEDPVLGNMISELIKLYNDRSEILYNSKKDNPYSNSIELRIKNMKRSMLENLENLTNATNISLQDIDNRINQASARVNKLPETQRQLFGYERKFKLNDAIYTYLLTKRSEMEITKASFVPENEVIDAARPNQYLQVAPNTRKIYLWAFILGLGVPALFILLKDYLNDKIQFSEDIEKITEFPILGHILRSKNKSRTIAADQPMSLTSESIRAIRTNFQYIANEKAKHVVLVTSSMMNEGKSFVCLNLALSFASNNKKCIILSFDLRKPKISEYIGIDYDSGISTYLSTDISLDEIIIPTRYPNLDVILSGPNPPNPMELISGEKTKELFKSLKEKYDYIFVDTPPVGMVADSLILLKYSDINIYVIRHSFTLKKMFAGVIQNLRKRAINNVNIVINDVPVAKKYLSYSHGYAYNYGYGYGYGYYHSESSGKSSDGKKKSSNFIRSLIERARFF